MKRGAAGLLQLKTLELLGLGLALLIGGGALVGPLAHLVLAAAHVSRLVGRELIEPLVKLGQIHAARAGIHYAHAFAAGGLLGLLRLGRLCRTRCGALLRRCRTASLRRTRRIAGSRTASLAGLCRPRTLGALLRALVGVGAQWASPRLSLRAACRRCPAACRRRLIGVGAQRASACRRLVGVGPQRPAARRRLVGVGSQRPAARRCARGARLLLGRRVRLSVGLLLRGGMLRGRCLLHGRLCLPCGGCGMGGRPGRCGVGRLPCGRRLLRLGRRLLGRSGLRSRGGCRRLSGLFGRNGGRRFLSHALLGQRGLRRSLLPLLCLFQKRLLALLFCARLLCRFGLAARLLARLEIGLKGGNGMLLRHDLKDVVELVGLQRRHVVALLPAEPILEQIQNFLI